MNLFQHDFKDTPVTLDLQRSHFSMNHNHKTTFDQGQLVPIFLSEVLPGDTFSVDMSSLVRMSTPVFPVMDNAFLDVYFFFAPSRILWDHFKEFMGENTTSPWTQTTEYLIPKVRCTHMVEQHDLACYLGIPARTSSIYSNFEFNALPFRAYYMIWNEWFRDENLQYPINVYTGDSSVTYNTVLTNGFRFGKDVLPVCRLPDYFSTALPAPQKGPAVNLPLGDQAPVYAGSTPHSVLKWNYNPLSFTSDTSSDYTGSVFQRVGAAPDTGYANYQMIRSSDYAGTPDLGSFSPNNLYVDLEQATASTVNELRQAFAVQRLFERDALGGTRFREQLRSHFGTTIPDSTVQIPEYLGGFRQPINIDQVVQTSSTDSTSPLATPSAVSVTTHVDNSLFTKSFVEPGYILGLACVRVSRSYSQGVAPLWMRERRFDFYYPSLANIGNQPIYKYELMATTGNINDKPVFGYKEAWAEYRFMPNRNSGLFCKNVGGGTLPDLQSWIYGDYYNGSVALSDEWIREGNTNVQNTLAVQNEDQFLADFYFKVDAYRPMPLYSVPGLIDHH